MFRTYCYKLAFRVIIFLIVLYGYIVRPEIYEYIVDRPLLGQIPWTYIIWGILMFSMITHMLPTKSITMGSKKRFVENFHVNEGYDKLNLYQYVQKNNIAAIWVLIIWLSFNAIFGIFYLRGTLEEKELILISVFFYVCDLICVVIWCPFQSYIIKNKCCVNCRIFNWGHFMMFTPLLFIVNFFTWSLFFTSLIVMLRWELTLLKYPERFWEESNTTLQCVNCKDKICKFKGAKFIKDGND